MYQHIFQMPLPKYTPQAMAMAVGEVRQKKMTYAEASKEYDVPYTTLRDKVLELHPGHTSGPKRTLSLDEETAIAKYLSYLSFVGYPFTRKDCRRFIQQICARKV